jgi:hypothetical protein
VCSRGSSKGVDASRTHVPLASYTHTHTHTDTDTDTDTHKHTHTHTFHSRAGRTFLSLSRLLVLIFVPELHTGTHICTRATYWYQYLDERAGWHQRQRASTPLLLVCEALSTFVPELHTGTNICTSGRAGINVSERQLLCCFLCCSLHALSRPL